MSYPVLIPMPARCDCGATVTAAPAGDRDWTWVDADGKSVIDRSPPGYREDPKGWWERLAREDIAAYSDLSARVHLGHHSWTHVHRPAEQEPYTGPVPECCDMPMRAIPAGWECRVDGTIHPYDE